MTDMHLVPKINRMQVSLAEMQRKLRWLHARRKRNRIRCMGGMLEGGMSTCNV